MQLIAQDAADIAFLGQTPVWLLYKKTYAIRRCTYLGKQQNTSVYMAIQEATRMTRKCSKQLQAFKPTQSVRIYPSAFYVSVRLKTEAHSFHFGPSIAIDVNTFQPWPLCIVLEGMVSRSYFRQSRQQYTMVKYKQSGSGPKYVFPASYVLSSHIYSKLQVVAMFIIRMKC
ncbi:Hypothetical_protein [Hexamita inflata]|uniref:Hypothetical_protein n=1 Tax=Hexamita inflata TaxID=28002 RepID=A0AA86NAA3_9EUKA|nr:Hypothetical protein HINF_LOCUS3260 [Hexamita inflata]